MLNSNCSVAHSGDWSRGQARACRDEGLCRKNALVRQQSNNKKEFFAAIQAVDYNPRSVP